MEHDIVCGMEIKNTLSAPLIIYKGKTYYFCTDLCKIQFEQEPEKYIQKGDSEQDEHQD
ncbi:MAG: YHS domain-containing protein [Ignavibacteriae bacterium]|nr:YHS domain-containing protein [Ignavibacteriota bacterium]NOG99786.1 YHS domain-containing protein [Ignavibacteriota bacterium]